MILGKYLRLDRGVPEFLQAFLCRQINQCIERWAVAERAHGCRVTHEYADRTGYHLSTDIQAFFLGLINHLELRLPQLGVAVHTLAGGFDRSQCEGRLGAGAFAGVTQNPEFVFSILPV